MMGVEPIGYMFFSDRYLSLQHLFALVCGHPLGTGEKVDVKKKRGTVLTRRVSFDNPTKGSKF